ncbi:hypothetical protein DFP72DRAFT_1068973 [Ephemerocybe angulata]|uniref:MYND-type domain-containing protein n=1 Tax=Ephemerocybe angulata TaxID=980116 RepID=A0A8H6M5V2_9AGAR|nr:hypothetical protein DFP72DRAFT_1068973 [Tulosesus angulatus]
MAMTTTGRLPIEAVLSLEAAVDLLTTSMSSPFTTPICASRMHMAAKRIEHALQTTAPTTTAAVKFSKSFPRLLRAGIRFLTYRQTQEAHDIMTLRLACCRCEKLVHGKGPEAAEQMRKLHDVEMGNLPDMFKPLNGIVFLHSTVNTVVVLIHTALSGSTKHKFRTPVPGKDKRDQPWPLSGEDLLPNGLPDSVHGLELWSSWEDAGGSIIFALATALAGFYQPFAQALLQPPDYTFAISRPLKHLTSAMEYYDSHSASNPLVSTVSEFEDPIKHIFDYFQMLVVQDPAEAYHSMIIAKISEMTPVFSRLSAILSSLPASVGPQARDQWNDILIGMQLLINIGNKTFGQLDTDTAKLAKAMADPVRDGLSEMVVARKGGCANLRCPKKMDGVYSRLCAKCDLMRYCGPECQKEAWKSLMFPHKTLCAKIHTFKRSLTKQSWSLLWNEEKVDMDAFLAMRTTSGKPVDAKLVGEIGTILSEMKALKTLYGQIGMGVSEYDFLTKMRSS